MAINPPSQAGRVALTASPKTSPVSVPHRRTRRDHASETAEDYVEAIAQIVNERSACRVVDLAGHFAVSHVTVSRILSRLESLGLVETQRYQPVKLTRQGLKLASQSKERHDTVYNFLLALGVSPKTAAIDTEGIEHHVSPETLRRLRAFTRRRGQA